MEKTEMINQKLYGLFCAENCYIEDEFVIRIDNKFNTIYEIYSFFGSQIYKKYKYINSIMPDRIGFFGGSPDGFSDCLTDFLSQNNREILRIEIIEKGNEISEEDIYIFLYILSSIMVSYDSKLRVLISKEILDIYLKESKRLIDLDTDPNDFVQY